jgi:hypothetical protein
MRHVGLELHRVEVILFPFLSVASFQIKIFRDGMANFLRRLRSQRLVYMFNSVTISVPVLIRPWDMPTSLFLMCPERIQLTLIIATASTMLLLDLFNSFGGDGFLQPSPVRRLYLRLTAWTLFRSLRYKAKPTYSTFITLFFERQTMQI